MFITFTLTITAGASSTALVVVIKQIKNIPKEYFSKICEKRKDTSTGLKNYDKSVCQNVKTRLNVMTLSKKAILKNRGQCLFTCIKISLPSHPIVVRGYRR